MKKEWGSNLVKLKIITKLPMVSPLNILGKSGVGSKADDPSGSKQTILKRIKADDPGRKQTIHGSKQTIRAKADDLLSKRTIF